MHLFSFLRHIFLSIITTIIIIIFIIISIIIIDVVVISMLIFTIANLGSELIAVSVISYLIRVQLDSF